ncbi:MAG: polysaccharide biosynthesis/export family protein [Thermodesulfobacteriota bacterium]
MKRVRISERYALLLSRFRQCVLSLALLAGLFHCQERAWAQDEAYRLGPRDALVVSVWKDEALTRQIVVPPDGTITFPLIGDIEAGGRTLPELREVLREKLSEYVPDPTVTVMLVTANSMTAYVIGKVNRPGEFPIGMESNVMQILAMAGGLNPFAASARILLLRQEGKKTIKIPFDYGKVEKGEDIGQNILLRRGDVVVVP